jgi:chaperonin GroES
MVVVRRDKAETETKQGIHIVETAVEKPLTGVVLSAGPGRVCDINGHLVPMSVKAGDRVVFRKYVGTPSPGEEDVVVMGERDLLAVIEG